MGCKDHESANLTKYKSRNLVFLFSPQANEYEFVVAWQRKMGLCREYDLA
jgi:hypothetical protein